MKSFKSLPKLVFYIVDLYVKTNPTAGIDDIVNTFSPMLYKSCDMQIAYPFIKETGSIIASGADIKRFSKKEIFINGKSYRVSTQWGYQGNGKIEIDHLIKFAKDELGEIVEYVCGSSVSTSKGCISCQAVAELKQNDDKLISFYIAETRSVLTKQQYDDITNVEVVIDETDEPYYEVVGRYDLREIVEEIGRLLEKDKNRNAISDFRRLLEILLCKLQEILKSESRLLNSTQVNRFSVNGEPFKIQFSGFGFMAKTNELESDLKVIIEEISRMLNEGQWPKETRRLIEDILNRIYPQIVARKRVSTVLGKFTASKKRITLYKAAIENWLPDVDCFDKLLDVYSHELFHAFHYFHVIENRQKWEYDDNSRIVKESLARYIEYRYGLLNICKTAISSDLIRMWNDYDMYDFPYAGAKYVEKYNGLCELMFKESVNKGTKNTFHLIESAYNL